jgi:hypothetical protein
MVRLVSVSEGTRLESKTPRCEELYSIPSVLPGTGCSARGGTMMIDGVTLAYIMQSHRARFDAWYRNMSIFVFKPVKAQDTAPH